MERRETVCDHLIDSIYDAGARPERWPSVLTAIAGAAGAAGGVVFGFSKSRGLVFEYNGSLDARCADIFKIRHANNVWVQGMAGRPRNQLVVSDSLIKRRDLMQLEFYDEVLKPQRLAYAALAALTAGSDIDIQFSIQKSLHGGPFNSRELTTLRRLLPHVRRALGVSLRLTPGDPAADGLNTVTERLHCAALTLNRRGELLDANKNAQRLAQDGLLPLAKNALTWSEPAEQRRFLKALQEIRSGASLRTLQMVEGIQRYEVVCTALGPRTQPAIVLVLLSLVSVKMHNLAEPRSRLTDALTAAERRVTQAAASGLSTAEIAGELDISRNTVKTHLRRVYYKLDVKRQSELIILMNRVGLE